MALTQRQMACFESNRQFLNEVAAALLPGPDSIDADGVVVFATERTHPGYGEAVVAVEGGKSWDDNAFLVGGNGE